MANFVFNVARGRIGELATLPQANDAFIAIPFEAAGLESDAVLMDYPTLAAITSSTNVIQTTMGRKTLTNVTTSVDNTNDRRNVDADDIQWVTATGNIVGALVICYDPDTTVGTDSDIIPLIKLDMNVNPSGVNLTYQFNAEGFYRAS